MDKHLFQIFTIALLCIGACFAELSDRKLANLVDYQASSDGSRSSAEEYPMSSNPLFPKITNQELTFRKHFYTGIRNENFRKSIYDIFDETTRADVPMRTGNTIRSSTSSSTYNHLDITWNLAGRLLKVRGKRRVTQDDEGEVGGAASSQHGEAAGAASPDRDSLTVPEPFYKNIHS